MSKGERKATALLTSTAARLCRIERALRRGRLVTFAELLKATNTSSATLKRDMQLLRDELGAPIEWDAIARGYRITAAWTGVAAALFEQMEAA